MRLRRGAGEALFFVGRRGAAIGLTGVALCHDVLVALALVRARRRLGLAGLTAMLAAHVGLTFEIVFTGHAGSMRRHDIGSFFSVNEFIGPLQFAVHDHRRAPAHRNFRSTDLT